MSDKKSDDLTIKSDIRAGLDLSSITKPFEDLAKDVSDAVNKLFG